MFRATLRTQMFRATTLKAMDILVRQIEIRKPLTAKDKVVDSFTDEWLRPPTQAKMEAKYGMIARYADPALSTVDTSQEIVLNSYPDGPSEGLTGVIEGKPTDESWAASCYDEKFFRKFILAKEKADEDQARVQDYTLNAVTLGLTFICIRYMLAQIWWVGQPKMTLMAESNIEAEFGKLDPKQCKTIVWRGKPVYVYQRTEFQVKDMENTPLSALKHPEADIARFPEKRDIIAVIAICTHLGCIPFPNEGVYQGFFCPCHGSHYDISGRIRQGPAPLNLEIPPHKWINNETIFLGTK